MVFAMIPSQRTLTYIFLAASLISGCSSNMRLNRDFRPEIMNSKSIAVILPEIDFFVKYGHKEQPEAETSLEVARIVQDAIANVLRREGIEVVSNAIIESLLAGDQNLTLGIGCAKQSFVTACDSIFRTKDEFISLTLGADLKEFVKRTQADYLIFVKGTGYQRPGTARNIILNLNSVGINHNQLNGLFLEIAIVDVNTGKILWFNRNHHVESDYDPLRIDRVEILCGKLLKNLVKS